MATTPWWKVKREMLRLGRWLALTPGELLRKLYVRRYYDLVLSRQSRLTPGDLEAGDEVGIYLIFPKDGVLPSHLTTLHEMGQAGVTPFVVSNLPLTVTDIAQLRPLVWQIMERPNFGYDFGGYRDGVLALKSRLQDLNRLWILNDSVWHVAQPQSWFEQARALETDMCAATSNYGMPRVDPERFRDITWDFRVGHRNFHYASYALGFGREILRDQGFTRFWQKLDIRNDKTRTVRRGEIGLTQWVLQHGYSHRATCEVDNLDKELAELSDPDINRIAQELVIPDDKRLEQIKATVLATAHDTAQGRADRISLILATVSRRASGYTLPGYTLRNKGFQFLKKSPLWLSKQSAQVMLGIIDGLECDNRAEIAAEARALAICDRQQP